MRCSTTHPEIGSPSRRAFTLIELLVALAIAVLVAGILVTLYRTATRTVVDQGSRARGPHAASVALDQLADDLARAVLQVSSSNDWLTLESAGVSNAILAFCTLEPAHGTEPDWAIALRVRYQLEADGSTATRLVRLHRPLTGPGSLGGWQTNVLVPDAETFSVLLFDGAEWLPMWAGKAGDSRRPQAARISIGSSSWSGETGLQQADLMIPAGMSATSSVIRGSVGAAP